MATEALLTPGLSQIFQAYLAGVGTSFTPCVYPLIPITLSVIGSRSRTSRLESFSIAASYVFGICCTYTILGLLSAFSGAVFGSALGNPWIVLAVSLLLLLLACSSLDLFTSQALTKIQTIASKFGGSGLRGAFVMGAASGIVAAPCVGPVLVLILGIAASQGNAFWGGALLFSYSLGFGSLFLLLGAFPSLLQRLPRSGNWLFLVKFIIAAALLLALLFIAQRYTLDLILPLASDVRLISVIAIVCMCLLLYLARSAGLKFLRLPAALCLALAISPFTLVESVHPGTELEWHSTIEAAQQAEQPEASSTQVHTIVDFAADWCAACKELEAKTFSDPNISKRLKRARLARIDFTEPDETLAESYNIQGLPAVLFLDAQGVEIAGSRVSGFMSPEEFGEHLSKLGL